MGSGGGAAPSRAVLPPTPETLIRWRKNSRSTFVAKPYRIWASSRMEINTLGSKSNHAEMQKIVVQMKDELEQIKEQVLNVM